MSRILDRASREEVPKPVRDAQTIQRHAASLFQQVETTWNNAVTRVWKGDTATILEAFGTDAVEFFRVSAETAKFLEALKPGCTAAGRALMRPFTAHADGRITLNA